MSYKLLELLGLKPTPSAPQAPAPAVQAPPPAHPHAKALQATDARLRGDVDPELRAYSWASSGQTPGYITQGKKIAPDGNGTIHEQIYVSREPGMTRIQFGGLADRWQ